MAYNPGWKDHARSHTKGSTNAPLKNCPDADLLDEPFAQAVQEFNYHPQDILLAVKNLQKRQQSLTAEQVLQELMDMEIDGRIRRSATASASPSSRRKGLKRAASFVLQQQQQHDPYGSDGEEREEDPGSLEEDGGGGAAGRASSGKVLVVSEAKGGVTEEPTGPPLKKATFDNGDGEEEKEEEEEQKKGGVDMRRRVLALRQENRRLKARHLCRKCGEQPVSLTFLPCGHFSFCQQCGQSLNTCPLCRKPILADVRTFLA